MSEPSGGQLRYDAGGVGEPTMVPVRVGLGERVLHANGSVWEVTADGLEQVESDTPTPG